MDRKTFQATNHRTIIRVRYSGSSHLNRVELQNGCLSLGHANLFIPSTIGGSCGNVEAAKLVFSNRYISRVNGSPYSETK